MASGKKANHNRTVIRRTVQKAIKYRRVSVIRDNMTTMETQDEMIEGYCKLHKWEVVADLGDPGISAFSGKHRPDFEKAIQMIESGQADAIVVFKIDRFSRSITEFVEAWERIKAAGGTFVSVTEQFDTSTPMGELMLMLIMGFAQMESQMKSERALPMHQWQRDNGRVSPGPRPYGYAKIDSKDNDGQGAKLVPIKKEVDLLNLAADWVIDGKSLSSFVSTFQPESSIANKQMTYRGLKCALINPAIAGLRTNPQAEDGYTQGVWDAIIDRAKWERVCEILTAADRRTAETNEKSHLLSGLMHCPKCAKNVNARNWVHPKSREITKRYMCPECLTSVDMAAVDGIAIDALFDTVTEAKWDSWQTSGKGWDSDIVADIENRLGAVDRMFSTGKLTENRWLDMTADLQSQLEACQNNEPLDIPMVPNLRAAWSSMTLQDKQRVFRQAFESILILPQNGSRNPRSRIALNER